MPVGYMQDYRVTSEELGKTFVSIVTEYRVLHTCDGM